jgi:hypothetical protein
VMVLLSILTSTSRWHDHAHADSLREYQVPGGKKASHRVELAVC